MVEMGLSLTGQSFILKPLSADQIDSINELKGLDINLLTLLSAQHKVQGLDPLGSPLGLPLKGSALCSEVLCRINRQTSCLGEDGDVGNALPTAVKRLEGMSQSVSPSGQWSNSCALEMDERYRFLIRPNSQIDDKFPYFLHSCALKYEGIGSGSRKCNIESSP